jgi:hypothetical protein
MNAAERKHIMALALLLLPLSGCSLGSSSQLDSTGLRGNGDLSDGEVWNTPVIASQMDGAASESPNDHLENGPSGDAVSPSVPSGAYLRFEFSSNSDLVQVTEVTKYQVIKTYGSAAWISVGLPSVSLTFEELQARYSCAYEKWKKDQPSQIVLSKKSSNRC